MARKYIDLILPSMISTIYLVLQCIMFLIRCLRRAHRGVESWTVGHLENMGGYNSCINIRESSLVQWCLNQTDWLVDSKIQYCLRKPNWIEQVVDAIYSINRLGRDQYYYQWPFIFPGNTRYINNFQLFYDEIDLDHTSYIVF